MKLLQDLEVKAADRAAALQRHREAEASRGRVFTAQVAEMRKLLEQVQDEFNRVETEARTSWAAFNDKRDARDAEVAALARQRLDQLRLQTPSAAAEATEPGKEEGNAVVFPMQVAKPSDSGK